MAGLYLEEFKVGQVIRHQLTKTVTESDNMLFSTMTLNAQPLHIDFDSRTESTSVSTRIVSPWKTG